MPIPDFQGYGELVYSLQERYPSIRQSTLVLTTIGPTLAKVEGQIFFDSEVVLDIWELLDFDARRILNYSYEVYRAGEKIAWYDPFEHPHIPELAASFPHHKHILPDIKHNRIPAPGISYEHANLPSLIEEIEREIIPPHRRA
jgi:Family of unknown function (DUF6516)